MLAKSVLITGCNRGIGLELVKQILKMESPPAHLFATYRSPSTSGKDFTFQRLLYHVNRRSSQLNDIVINFFIFPQLHIVLLVSLDFSALFDFFQRS